MLVLSGGTGTPKLLLGLKGLLRPEEFSVVVNTAEDLWISGNYISPDVDSVLYTLANMIDEKRMWGIKGRQDHHSRLSYRDGYQREATGGGQGSSRSYLSLRAASPGVELSHATQVLAESLGVEQQVVPMTDDVVSTVVSTSEGVMHFQEFWVGRRGKPEVLSLFFAGLDAALPCQAFLDLLKKEDIILIGPSNPVTSIGPILALQGVRERLQDKKVVAISPFIGNKPVSGPAAKFMQACGASADDEGVRALLGKVDLFVVDKKSNYRGECHRMSTLMRTRRESGKVAKELLELISVAEMGKSGS